MACKGGCNCLGKLKDKEDHLNCPGCGAIHMYTYDQQDGLKMEGYVVSIVNVCSLCGCEWKDYYKFLGKREILEEPSL